jgi:hypothetical protein
VISDFDCWYYNGFAAAQWKADKKDQVVKDCTLRLTEDKLVVVKGKVNVSCPWGGVGVRAAPSDHGNAVLTVTMKGDHGGTSKIVLPSYSPNAFWAELWRVVPAMRSRLTAVKPEILAGSASALVLLDYLGGYPLRPKKSFTNVRVELHQFGVTVKAPLRDRRELMLPWRDTLDLSLGE